jgi:RecJ-like exonuclease
VSNLLTQFKNVVYQLELLERMRAKLTQVRLIHESDEETFDRMMKLAKTCICKECRGYGRLTFGDGICKTCNGTGNLQGLEPT